MFINGDTTAAARAGGLGFYWKQITEEPPGPVWSTDTVTSNGVTLTGHAWTPAASVTPEYDFDGNLTNDGRWDYLWDAENRLIRMTTTFSAANAAGVPRQRLDFVYDSQGRRISKTVSTSPDGNTWTVSTNRRFLYDGWNLIAEYSPLPTGNLKLETFFIWGLDLSGTPQGAGGVGGLLAVHIHDPQSSIYYPAYDGNGNISAWISEVGTLLARMDYSPFGQLIAHHKFTSDAALSRLPFGFSTKYTDAETGLLYYGYRWYDPLTGRWPSRDPIGERGGVNLYAFLANNGVGFVDRLGNRPDPVSVPHVHPRPAAGPNIYGKIQFVGKGPTKANYRNNETLWAAVFFQHEWTSDCECIVSKLHYSGTGFAELYSDTKDTTQTEYFFHSKKEGIMVLDLVNFHQYHEAWDGPNRGQPPVMYLGLVDRDPETVITVVWTYKVYKNCPANAEDSFEKSKGGEPLHYHQNTLWDVNEANYPYSDSEPSFWSGSGGKEHQYTLTIKGSKHNNSGWIYTDSPQIGDSGKNVGVSGNQSPINYIEIPRSK